MTTFIIVAAVMAALAAAAVAVPLLRDRRSRLVGAAAGVLVMGAAAALYPLWSNFNWHAPAGEAQAPDVLAMVAKLESHLRDQPQDFQGWLMLGRSYLALDRLDDAILAYDHAHQLDAGNADAALGLGEAMSMRAGGTITPAAAQLFEQAVARAPNNPKALLYAGFAAASRGDKAAARDRWQALKDMHPPAQIEQLLDARIAELGPIGAAPVAGAGAGAGGGSAMANSRLQAANSATQTTNAGADAASGAGQSTASRPPMASVGAPAAEANPAARAGGASAGASSANVGAPAADVTVTIGISPALKSRLTPRGAAVRVRPRTRRAGAAVGGETLDRCGHRHPKFICPPRIP